MKDVKKGETNSKKMLASCVKSSNGNSENSELDEKLKRLRDGY
jgi:hypothetical protein